MADDRPVIHGGRSLGLALLAVCLLMFTLFRAALFLFYRESFRSLSIGDTAVAFLDGARFDLSIIMLVVGVPLLLLLLPVARRWWFVAWSVAAAVLAVLLAVLLTADFIYFGQAGRHVGQELRSCWGDVGFLVTAGLQYWPALALFAGLLAAAPFAALALARRRFKEGPVSAGRVALTVAVALPLFV